MSEKAKSKLNKGNVDKKSIISVNSFQYLKNVELIKNSVSYYIQQLQGEYLKLLSLDLGYKPEQDLQFGIDLEGDTRELTVHIVTDAEKRAIEANKS